MSVKRLSLLPDESDNEVLTGYLELYNPDKWFKKWNSRYFTLRNNGLYYSESEFSTEFKLLLKVLGLKTSVQVADTKTHGKKTCFEIYHTSGVIVLCAASVEEKDKWIDYIKNILS